MKHVLSLIVAMTLLAAVAAAGNPLYGDSGASGQNPLYDPISAAVITVVTDAATDAAHSGDLTDGQYTLSADGDDLLLRKRPGRAARCSVGDTDCDDGGADVRPGDGGINDPMEGFTVSMNKTELIDAMARNAGLSKADSKKALEGFIASPTFLVVEGTAVTVKAAGSFVAQMHRSEFVDPDYDGDGLLTCPEAARNGAEASCRGVLKKGDRLSLVGFGSFIVSKRADRAAGSGLDTANGLIDEVREDDKVEYGIDKKDIRRNEEGRKGLNAVNVKVLGIVCCDGDSDGDGLGDLIAELTKDFDGKAIIGKVAVDNKGEILLEEGRDMVMHDGGKTGASDTGISKRSARKNRPPQSQAPDQNDAPDVTGPVLAVSIAPAIASISKRSARTGRNPQTGKEIQIAVGDTPNGDKVMRILKKRLPN